MSRPLRDRDPSNYRLITIRTVRGELWLKPDGKTRNLIGGILSKYQEIFEIELYAYTFLGNHFHLLLKAPKGNTDEFCENVNREIAKRINWRFKREGALWGRRYDDQEVLRDEDLIEAFLYVTTNTTRHGLLSDASKWEGLHSYEHALSERHREFTFTNYSLRDESGIPLVTRHKLKLSVLPELEGLTKKKRKSHLRKILKDRIEQLQEERKGAFLGITRVRAQPIGALPQNVSRSPRPDCYSFCPKSIKEFKERRKELHGRYAESSIRYRLGEHETRFPKFTFHPPLHRTPRSAPFKKLTKKYLKANA